MDCTVGFLEYGGEIRMVGLNGRMSMLYSRCTVTIGTTRSHDSRNIEAKILYVLDHFVLLCARVPIHMVVQLSLARATFPGHLHSLIYHLGEVYEVTQRVLKYCILGTNCGLYKWGSWHPGIKSG